MINTLKIFFASICLIAAINVQTAHAQLVIYPNRAAFDAAIPTASVEGWDTYAAGTVINNGQTLNGITYTTNSANSVEVFDGPWLTTTGSGSLGENNGLGYFTTDSVTFTFKNPLTSFAIDINTFDTTAGDYTATLNDGTVIGSVYDPFSEAAYPFPGYYTGESIDFSDSTPFTSVTIENLGGDGYTLDTLQSVDPAPVPEPPTITLMLLGIMAFAIFALRRERILL